MPRHLLLSLFAFALGCTSADEPPQVAPEPQPTEKVVDETPPSAQPMKAPPTPKKPGEAYGFPSNWECAICTEGQVGTDFTVAEGQAAAFDGDLDTAWCAPAKGAVLEVTFPKNTVLGDVFLHGGHMASSETLNEHGRVKRLVVQAKGQEPASTLLHDPAWSELERVREFPVGALGLNGATTAARLEVAEVYAGSGDDVCVAEVLLIVGPADPG